MRNLFIVNTPLHLFTAYILANYYMKDEDNVLMLANPKSHSRWNENRCIAYMAHDTTTWDQIIVADKSYKQKIKSVGPWQVIKEFKDKFSQNGGINQVYIASDKTLLNQFIVELSGNTTYIRFEEGSASYIPYDRKWSSKAGEYLLLQLLRLMAGLRSDFRYNFSGVGLGLAGTADYLYKPHLLERYSPDARLIEPAAIYTALDKVLPVMQDYEQLAGPPVIMYLGSNLVEHDKVDAEKEIGVLKELSAQASAKGYRLLYKPHPSERPEKLKDYIRRFPSIDVFSCLEPMEIILYKYNNIRYIASTISSAMIYADVFSKSGVVLISTVRLDAKQNWPDLEDLFNKNNVRFPSTLEELGQIIV